MNQLPGTVYGVRRLKNGRLLTGRSSDIGNCAMIFGSERDANVYRKIAAAAFEGQHVVGFTPAEMVEQEAMALDGVVYVPAEESAPAFIMLWGEIVDQVDREAQNVPL